jgi:hypothetical protein
MMKKISYFILIFCLLFISACQREGKSGYAPPAVIPNTTREMKSPGFWISRNSFADKVVLDSSAIALFNSEVEYKLGLTEDVAKIGPNYSGKELSSFLEKELKGLFLNKLFDRNAKRINSSFLRAIREEINFSAIPVKINVRYGFIRHYADQRILPTEEALFSQPGDVEFDELQNSSLDIGTPLAVLHESKDGLWIYVHSPASSGWVRKDRVVVCTFAELKSYLEKEPFVVVTNAKADIFLDPGLTQYFDYVRMGVRFPVKKDINPGVIQISIPFQIDGGKFNKRNAYMRKEDINSGYLLYTPRNIIQQAFKLLNAPYGWGGMNGEQDCSSFLQEIFSTVGIYLPRNSQAQCKVGKQLGALTEKTNSASKLLILDKLAIGGATILQLKGHILLYLGSYKGSPYVIHETHGYRQKKGWKDILCVVNRVVVSDLSLGQGSKNGSLLERLLSICNVN